MTQQQINAAIRESIVNCSIKNYQLSQLSKEDLIRIIDDLGQRVVLLTKMCNEAENKENNNG